MKRYFFFTVFAFAIAVFSNCKGSRYVATAGEAVERVSTFWETQNNIDTVFTILNDKAWYKDSIGITQVSGIFTEESDTGRAVTIRTIKYRFVDLRKRWGYEYTSFTDTATIIRKFLCTDSALYTGGWNFANRTPFAVDSFQFYPDTTISAVPYKRCKVSYVFNQTRFHGLGMLRCDKKSTIFQIDTAISNKVGCPLVFFRLYADVNPHAGFDTDVKFISNQLPDSVAKVFAAWKKNESLYPVH